MTWAHADTGVIGNSGTGPLPVTLSNPVGSGDLLVAAVEAPGPPTIADTAGNTWTVSSALGGGFIFLAYCLSSAGAPGGITVTASVLGDFPRTLAVDRFTVTGSAVFGAFGPSGSGPTTQGLNFSSAYNLSDLGTVPAGALVWGSFVCGNGAGDQSYTAGFQSGSAGTPNAISSQMAGSTGTAFSAYVLAAANSDAALTWFGTGTNAGGNAGAVYFTATPPVPFTLPASAPMPPGAVSPAAWQHPQYRTVPPAPGRAYAPAPPVPLAAVALPAAPLLPPAPFTPMSVTRRRPALPRVFPSVTITTTGSAFTPVIELAGGSAATVTWSCPGFASKTGLTPSFSFGSTAIRTVTMTVTGGGGPADVTALNLGHDNTVDVGTYMPPARFVKSAESVSAVANIGTLTGLVYFLADHTALAGALDFTGMAALQFIQCYATNVTAVKLTGCTALIRLNVEVANVSYLDLNPVAGNLYDLRAAAQQGGALAFATLAQPMAVEYHYCVHDNILTNSIPLSQLPVINQYWTWNGSLSGTLAPQSSALNDLESYGNAWTSADFTNQFTAPLGNLDLHGCALASVNLAGCSGLITINLHHNRLRQAAVDSILATVAGFGTSNNTIDLAGNTAPSAAGLAYAAQLTGRGWAVHLDSAGGGPAVQQVSTGFGGGNFTTTPTLGDTVFLVVCAYTTSGGAISSSAPLFNLATPPGAVKLQEVISPLNGVNGDYHAIWMMPACADGLGNGYGLTVTGADGTTALDAYDVSGLGVAPMLDVQASSSATAGSAVNSGPTPGIGFNAELVLGVSQAGAGASAGPGSPWTAGTPPDNTHGWSGYQVAATPGVFDWAQTASGSGSPWTAGIVAVAATAATSFPSPVLPALAVLPPGLASPGAWQFPQYRRLGQTPRANTVGILTASDTRLGGPS